MSNLLVREPLVEAVRDLVGDWVDAAPSKAPRVGTLGKTAAKHVVNGLHAVEEDLGGLGDNRVGVQLVAGAAGSLGRLGDIGGGGAVVVFEVVGGGGAV